ncbi:MAG: M28 family metallopeptidase, partial [Cellulosilyticaceae bacterium]
MKKRSMYALGMIIICIGIGLGGYYCFENSSSVVDTYHMVAYPYESNWVSRTIFKSEDYSQQIKEMEQWIDDLVEEKGENSFFVEEEFTNQNLVERQIYSEDLFEQNELFQKIIKNYSQQLPIVDDYIPHINKDLDKNNAGKDYFVRKTLYAESHMELKIDAKCHMEKGKMAIWIVSPQGEKIELSEKVTEMDISERISIEEGIWHIIYVFERDGQGELQGEKDVTINNISSQNSESNYADLTVDIMKADLENDSSNIETKNLDSNSERLKETLDTLSARERYTSEGLEVARKYILQELDSSYDIEIQTFSYNPDIAFNNLTEIFEEKGKGVLTDKYYVVSDEENNNEIGKNIVAIKQTKSTSDKAIILSAHYDSTMGNTGAYDNASGAAVLLEISRIISQIDFNINIYIVFFSHEEEGIVGSRYFVSEL